jgi:Arc/MetJ-type ribon-helix-helix transcriptional regulator
MPPRTRTSTEGIVNVTLGPSLLAELDAWVEENGVGKGRGGRSAVVAQAVGEWLARRRPRIERIAAAGEFARGLAGIAQRHAPFGRPLPSTRMGEVRAGGKRASRRRAPKL